MFILDEFSYQVAGWANGIMILSMVLLILSVSARKKVANPILKYTSLVVLLINVAFFVWILLNKELFHWNYDIATGKPVDHYSTFGRCIVMAGSSMISSAAATLLHFLKPKAK